MLATNITRDIFKIKREYVAIKSYLYAKILIVSIENFYNTTLSYS